MMSEIYCLKLIDDVLKIDKNIRYAGVFGINTYFGKMQKNTQSLLTPAESQLAQKQAFIRWQTRKEHSSKIGKPICAIGEYENIYRITMPFDENNLVLISAEKNIDVFYIIRKIRAIIETMHNV